jgi:hypothetical protein
VLPADRKPGTSRAAALSSSTARANLTFAEAGTIAILGLSDLVVVRLGDAVHGRATQRHAGSAPTRRCARCLRPRRAHLDSSGRPDAVEDRAVGSLLGGSQPMGRAAGLPVLAWLAPRAPRWFLFAGARAIMAVVFHFHKGPRPAIARNPRARDGGARGGRGGCAGRSTK